MAKDYGQRRNRHVRNNRSHAHVDTGSKSVPGWVWMVTGLSVGLAIAALVYIKRPLKTEADTNDTAAVMTGKAGAAKPEPLKLPPKEKPRFSFYTLLPNQEVVIPKDVQQLSKKPVTPKGDKDGSASDHKDDADEGIYTIQVASYRKAADAEAQRAKLALMGIDARIEKITIDNKDTFYRVRTSAQRGLAQAHATLERLDSNGLPDAVLMKMK